MPSRLLFALLLTPTFLPAQSAGNQPVHYQAVYTRIYSDDVEVGKTGNVEESEEGRRPLPPICTAVKFLILLVRLSST